MQLITFLYELVDTFGVLADGYPLLLRPEPSGCRVGCSVGNTYMIDGRTKAPVHGLTKCIGVFPDALKAALTAPGVDRATTYVTFDHKEHCIVICDKKGSAYVVPYMRESAAMAYSKFRPLNTIPDYEVTATPTFEGVELCNYWAKGEFAGEGIVPFTINGRLIFRFFGSRWEYSDILFTKRVIGAFPRDQVWNFIEKPFLLCFKVWRTCKAMELKFSDIKGMATLTVETTHSQVDVHIPATHVGWSIHAPYRGDVYEPQSWYDPTDPTYEMIYGDNLPT